MLGLGRPDARFLLPGLVELDVVWLSVLGSCWVGGALFESLGFLQLFLMSSLACWDISVETLGTASSLTSSLRRLFTRPLTVSLKAGSDE